MSASPNQLNTLHIGLINCRSICNKTPEILELIKDFDIDLCGITESWLKKADSAKIAEIKELGYETDSKPRAGRGGGVAFLYKSFLKYKPKKSTRYKSFECIESSIILQEGSHLWMACVYRSGTSALSTNIALFFQEFDKYLCSL